MRHITEAMLPHLLRILDEYEANIRSKGKLTITQSNKIYHSQRVRLQLSKRHE